jgi:hypothetical protein
VAARRAGRAVGGAVEGGIVDVIWTAGGALIGGTVEGGIVDVVRTAGGALVGGAVEGGFADVVCTTGGAVAGGTRGGDPGLWMVREVDAPWSSTYLVLRRFKPLTLIPGIMACCEQREAEGEPEDHWGPCREPRTCIWGHGPR